MGNNFNKNCNKGKAHCKPGYGIDYDYEGEIKHWKCGKKCEGGSVTGVGCNCLCKKKENLKKSDLSKINLDTCSCFSNEMNSCVFITIIIYSIIMLGFIALAIARELKFFKKCKI